MHGASGIAAYRVAVLGRPEDPMLPFIEDAAINRGLTARAFVSEPEALAWLRTRAAGSAH
ncbi:MAG TPA: hypothetical protein VEC19_04040 [Usitatibacter sp.]|nr:hypothetical protein [Usitatibacter sp.]